MDLNNYFVFGKRNLMKMRQPQSTRSYGTASTPDECKKMDSYKNIKLLTPAGLKSFNSGLNSIDNLGTTVCANCFKSMDPPKINLIKPWFISAFNNITVSIKENGCLVTKEGCKTISNNCAPISRSKSMQDLPEFYNCNQQDGSFWSQDLWMEWYAEIFGDLHPGTDFKLDNDNLNVVGNIADKLTLSDNHKKEEKTFTLTGGEKRHRFLKNKESIGTYHSLDEINKYSANTQVLSAIIPFFFSSFSKLPCCSDCENKTDINLITQKIDLNMDIKNANKSDLNRIELTDKNSLNNMTAHTVEIKLFPNDTQLISIKEMSLLNRDGGHTKADAKKETEKIIASPSLPDSNRSQLARCQIDKIELNITEINAECEGVTVACLEKNSRPVSNNRINNNDQKFSPITDNRRDYLADSNGKIQSPLSFDTVDHAGVDRVGSYSAKREPDMPHVPERRTTGLRYPPSALKVQSEVVDKTMQVSEGIDAILKRLGRLEDKSSNDTMKSHDNSLHRLSAGDGSGQGQQKVSRFLLKRAQEKVAEAARKAEKEAQEQCDSVLSCEEKMNKLKQLVSKKSDFISASAIDDSANTVRFPTVVAESDTYSRTSVHSPVVEKQYSNDDSFDKQNSLIKSDHNFYHTEATDGSVDCLHEIGSSDIIKCDRGHENICKSVTIATETEIINEEEIKCQIILPDPILPSSETSNVNVIVADRLMNVDSEEKSAEDSSKCSTTSVKLDCDSNAVGSDDKCDISTETTMCAVETVKDDIKSESAKSAPASVDSGLTELKSVTVAKVNEKMISESVKPVIDNVEDKMAKLKAMLAEKKKNSKYISNKPAVVNLVCENVQKCPVPDAVKEIKASRVLDSGKSIVIEKMSIEESKQRKVSVKLPVIKSDLDPDSCKGKPDCLNEKNEPEGSVVEIKKEPLTINDVEGSAQTEDMKNNSDQPICSKPPRKRGKGKSAKKENKKHKNENSLKKQRHKERDDHKRDIRDDLNFNADIEKTTGPLYFSTETLQLHTDSKKKHHGKKSKSNVRDRLDKCMNFISSLPAKVAICKPSVLEMQDENLLPNQSCDEFVMVDKDELPKILTCDKKKPCRVRLPSECESEDSFVICFQGSQEDLRNASDNSDDDFGDSACSETDSSDDDDDSTTGSCSSDDGYEGLAKKADDDMDSGVIVGIMKKRGYRDSPGRSVNKDKKVSFTSAPPKVHKMITWSYAYRQARIGTWERCARDAERFRQRVRDTSLSLDWVLKPQHRRLVFFHRFRPLLMRAIREEKEAKAKKAIEDKEQAIKDKEIEEELLKQKEIEDKEEAEQLEKGSAVIVDDILNEKIDDVDNFKDASSVTVSKDDNLVGVDNLRDKSPADTEKLLIVQKNEKCDLNAKINNVSNAKKGSLTVRTGKNGTRNVKSVSPLK